MGEGRVCGGLMRSKSQGNYRGESKSLQGSVRGLLDLVRQNQGLVRMLGFQDNFLHILWLLDQECKSWQWQTYTLGADYSQARLMICLARALSRRSWPFLSGQLLAERHLLVLLNIKMEFSKLLFSTLNNPTFLINSPRCRDCCLSALSTACPGVSRGLSRGGGRAYHWTSSSSSGFTATCSCSSVMG